MRNDLVHELDGDSVQTFSGDFGATDGGCGPLHAIEVPANTKSLDVAATADLPANDIVLDLLKAGKVVGHSDTATSPEAIHYAPAGDVTAGTYHARVCEFEDDAAPLPVTTYTRHVRRQRRRRGQRDAVSAALARVPARAARRRARRQPVERPEHRHPEALVLGEDVERRHDRRVRRGGHERGRPCAVGLRPEDEPADVHDPRQQCHRLRGVDRPAGSRARSATSRSRPTGTTRSRGRTPGTRAAATPTSYSRTSGTTSRPRSRISSRCTTACTTGRTASASPRRTGTCSRRTTAISRRRRPACRCRPAARTIRCWASRRQVP